MMKNKNLVWTIIGILFLIFVVPKLTIYGGFAIVQKVTCTEGIDNYYSLDGDFVDMKNNQDLINHGAVFVSGKMGQGLYFNKTTYVTFPNFSSNLNVGYWKNEGTGWVYISAPVSSLNGFLGLNATIDEIIIGTNVSIPFSVQPCYIQTIYENVTCQEYVLTQIPNPSGCVELSGDFFPNCSYQIKNQSYYKLENNICVKNYYCSGDTLSECSSKIQIPTVSSGNVVPAEETTQTSFASREIFNILGISITIIHLIVALLLIGGVLYFIGKNK